VGTFIGDERVALSFAAGAGRGGHTDRRQHRFGGFAVAFVVDHRPAVGQQEVDPLRTIHAGTAADGDDAIDAIRLSHGDPGPHFALGRVLLDAVEEHNVETRLTHAGRGPLRVPGFL
jgi:hypothetical protein